MKLVIIGGGASGLMLASILKKNNTSLEIVILEKLSEFLYKIKSSVIFSKNWYQ